MDAMSEMVAMAVIEAKIRLGAGEATGTPDSDGETSRAPAQTTAGTRRLVAEVLRDGPEIGVLAASSRRRPPAPSHPRSSWPRSWTRPQHHIADRGNGSSDRLIEAMAEVAMAHRAGAAAALVDRRAARPPGSVRSVSCTATSSTCSAESEHAWLLELLREGTTSRLLVASPDVPADSVPARSTHAPDASVPVRGCRS
jgi:hypothetical protein